MMSKKFKIEVRKSLFNEDEKLTKWQRLQMLASGI